MTRHTNRLRVSVEHALAIETMAKTGRRKDPPRSKWMCSCGASSDGKLMPPAEAHRHADAHRRGAIGMVAA
jgi:hypothetical protein